MAIYTTYTDLSKEKSNEFPAALNGIDDEFNYATHYQTSGSYVFGIEDQTLFAIQISSAASIDSEVKFSATYVTSANVGLSTPYLDIHEGAIYVYKKRFNYSNSTILMEAYSFDGSSFTKEDELSGSQIINGYTLAELRALTIDKESGRIFIFSNERDSFTDAFITSVTFDGSNFSYESSGQDSSPVYDYNFVDDILSYNNKIMTWDVSTDTVVPIVYNGGTLVFSPGTSGSFNLYSSYINSKAEDYLFYVLSGSDNPISLYWDTSTSQFKVSAIADFTYDFLEPQCIENGNILVLRNNRIEEWTLGAGTYTSASLGLYKIGGSYGKSFFQKVPDFSDLYYIDGAILLDKSLSANGTSGNPYYIEEFYSKFYTDAVDNSFSNVDTLVYNIKGAIDNPKSSFDLLLLDSKSTSADRIINSWDNTTLGPQIFHTFDITTIGEITFSGCVLRNNQFTFRSDSKFSNCLIDAETIYIYASSLSEFDECTIQADRIEYGDGDCDPDCFVLFKNCTYVSTDLSAFNVGVYDLDVVDVRISAYNTSFTNSSSAATFSANALSTLTLDIQNCEFNETIDEKTVDTTSDPIRSDYLYPDTITVSANNLTNTSGLWGYPRINNVGAYAFFDGTYYADVWTSAIGVSGDGTNSNPWDANQLIGFLDFNTSAIDILGNYKVIENGDVVKIRGFLVSASSTGSSIIDFMDRINNNVSATIESWNLNEYGPWGMSALDAGGTAYISWSLNNTDTSSTYITVKDAIFSRVYFSNGQNDVSGSKFDFKNCYFQDTLDITDYEGCIFYGCTFKNCDIYYEEYALTHPSFRGLEFNDCYFYDSYFDEDTILYDDSQITFNYCGSNQTSAYIFSASGFPDSYFALSNNNYFDLSAVTLTAGMDEIINRDNIRQFNVMKLDTYDLMKSQFDNNRPSYWNSNDYLTDLWGNRRKSVGALYHGQDTYYADISLSVNGLGTSGNPYQHSQMYQFTFLDSIYSTPFTSGDIVKIKGKTDINDLAIWGGYSIFSNEEITMEAWDLSTYGPYIFQVLRDDDDFAILDASGAERYSYNMNIKDAIFIYDASSLSRINYIDDYLKELNFKNCMFIHNYETPFVVSRHFESYPTSINFYGCNLVNQSSAFYLNSYDVGTINFTDCVIDMPNAAVSASGFFPVFGTYDLSATTFNNCETSISDSNLSATNFIDSLSASTVLADLPKSEDKDTFDKNDYIYEKYNISVNGTGTSVWEANDYNTGIGGLTRDGIGAFYFYSVNNGHIGAFYFGPISETVSANVMELSAVMLQPTISAQNAVSATVTPVSLIVNCQMLQPQNVYATQDFEVDFVGTPLGGSSPMSVEFTAGINLSPELKGKYKVKNYRWCFDYDYDNETCNIPWVTTTQNPYTHVYTGYRGQKYSVKCCVTLELI